MLIGLVGKLDFDRIQTLYRSFRSEVAMNCDLVVISLHNGVEGISQSALNCPNSGIIAGRAELFHA